VEIILEGGDAKKEKIVRRKCTSVDWRLMCLHLAIAPLQFHRFHVLAWMIRQTTYPVFVTKEKKENV